MEKTTTALSDFLLARYVEREAGARRLLKYAQENALMLEEPRLLGTTQVGWHEWPDVEAMCVDVLAGIEAKRRIVEWWSDWDGSVYDGWTNAAHIVLSELASTYADHPDYRQEWKP